MGRSKDGSGRRAPRIAIRLEGELGSQTAREIEVVDLSETGCLVQCPARLKHGAILDLDVRLGVEHIRTKVRVAEAFVDGAASCSPVRPYLAGLEFVGLPAQDHVRLVRFLDDARRRRAHPPAH